MSLRLAISDAKINSILFDEDAPCDAEESLVTDSDSSDSGDVNDPDYPHDDKESESDIGDPDTIRPTPSPNASLHHPQCRPQDQDEALQATVS
ncbi:hypothetical protein Hamer_G000115 [Homarus americanus]|uniref:Uncharacterized protein n=1 Tax=Homarus americanus TaxID=6706 RepID=A0A8J5TKE7_HOMAM|nr:hypothetical protein Hamer_G000115 [Homarus americanus]